MSNPRLRIDLQKIAQNTRRTLAISRAYGIEVMGVTKGAAGLPEVAKAMLSGGIKTLADSRLDNIARMRAAGIQTHTTLLRSPGPSDVGRTVELADASLNSDMEIVEAISIEARMQRKVHGVILMVDLPTGREGLPPDRIPVACRFMLEAEVIEVKAQKPEEAILALGKVDTDPHFLFPMNNGVKVREASSDHLTVRMHPPPRSETECLFVSAARRCVG